MTQTAQDFVRGKRVEAVTTPRFRAQCRLLEHLGIDPLEFLDRHDDGKVFAVLERIDFREIGAAGFLAVLGNKPSTVDGILKVRADVVLVDGDCVPFPFLFLAMLVACRKEQTGDLLVCLPFELPAVHITPETMQRRRDDLQMIVVRLIFLPHDLEGWREWLHAFALHLLLNESSQDVILQVIGVAFRTRELHGEVLLARGIIVEGVHDEFHVHDLMRVEHFDDLSRIAHVARETVGMPRDDAVRLPEPALVLWQIIEVIESLDCTEEIVELRAVVMACAHFLFHDVKDM